MPHRSAEKALKNIIIDLGELPPKTHALNRLKGMLSQLGLHTSELEDLKLNFLTRMHTSTRYPSEDLPPVQLFDQSDGEECLEIAEGYQFYSDDEEGRSLSKIYEFDPSTTKPFIPSECLSRG